MSETQLGAEFGASVLEMTTPFMFAGLSGAAAVAGALIAATFWRRASALEDALVSIEARIARDVSAERVFLVDNGRLTPASPATERFARRALAARSIDEAPVGVLGALFSDPSAQALDERLRALVGAASSFEHIGEDVFGGVWRLRGEIVGAQAVLRMWPERADAAATLSAGAAPSASGDGRAPPAGLLAQGLEQAPSGVLLFDAAGRLRAANAAARRLLRLRRELIDQAASLRAVIDILRDGGRLPERPDFKEWRARLLEDPVGVFAEEGVWALPDGLALRMAAERAADGGLVLLVTDETDAIALERRFRIAMGARRATFAAIDHGLAVIGADGRLHLANPAFLRLWGLDARLADERSTGQLSLAQLAREASRDLFDEAIWERIEAAAPLQAGGRRRSEGFTAERDGDRRLSVQITPLPDAATLVACADISAAHRAERALAERADALEAADRLKTEFLNDIAHQLRNPLNSVIGFSDMLRQGMAGTLAPRQDEYVGYVLAAANDLRELISDALDLGALNAGALSLRADAVDLSAIGESVAALLAKRAERRGAEFDARIDLGPAPVAGDENRLRHALFTAGAAVIAGAAATDRVATALELRRVGGEAEPSRVAFSVRLERRQPLEVDLEPLVEAGGVALSLARRVVEVHGGEAFFGETADRVEVMLELPLAAETGVAPNAAADDLDDLDIHAGPAALRAADA